MSKRASNAPTVPPMIAPKFAVIKKRLNDQKRQVPRKHTDIQTRTKTV